MRPKSLRPLKEVQAKSDKMSLLNTRKYEIVKNTVIDNLCVHK